MDDPKDIVKSNFDSYNKKLVFQDSILIVSLLFICINYFLIVESNYTSFKELAYRTDKIQTYNNKINNYREDIFKIVPDSVKSLISLNESDFKGEQAIEKLNPYLETKSQTESIQNKLSDIKSVINDKETLSIKNEDLKKKISESKDALSLVKILLFVNDRREHFALFLSVVVLIVLIYFYLTRKYLLNLLSRTLRIQKEKISFNEYYEYSLNYSIWLTPIPSRSSYSIGQSELLNVLAIRNTHSSYKKVMTISFILLICLQLRLYFIELKTNELLLNIYSWLSFIICIVTILITYFWLTPNYIPDNFNSEEIKNKGIKRRDFLALSFTVVPISIIALSIPALKHFGYSEKSSKVYNRLFNNPRFVSGSKNKSLSKTKNLEFEKQCLRLIATKQYDKSIFMLFSMVKNKASNKNDLLNQQTIRLSDLLARVLMFMIYQKKEVKYKNTLTQLTQVLDSSNNQTLMSRVQTWNNPNYKWITVCKDKKSIIKWNKIVFN